MPSLEASISIRCPAEKVFDFLAKTENLTKIIPDELKLRVVSAPSELALGARMEFQILAFGPPQNVVYEITEFFRPDRFTETQVKGLLPRYLHEHVFLSQADGTVLVTDRIEFEPPGGLMGFMLTADRLRTTLNQGLVHRHSALKRFLEDS
jgi:ligand-binding SRPBCC domain-containing protein